MKSNIAIVCIGLYSDTTYCFRAIERDNASQYSRYRILGELEKNENGDNFVLDSGRFKNFKYEIKSPFIVNVRLPYSEEDLHADVHTEEYFQEILPWIKDNIHGTWTMHCDFNSNDSYSFGFENETDAMHFSLRWK